ncbi:MAG TPA: CBS domain-containing protein [Myxococcales bacterium]|nr:CBS domain-containing protein [Myxococcales bacterium]
MLCEELMHRDVVCATPDKTIFWAARQMKDEDIGFLPVCDDHDKVIGTLTDRDIAVRVVADALPQDTRISEIMSHDVVACRAGDEIRVAEERMSAAQKSRLPVVDEQGRLEGVLSLSDIVGAEEPAAYREVFRHIKEPIAPTA